MLLVNFTMMEKTLCDKVIFHIGKFMFAKMLRGARRR
ncbi:MAG: hypothetical protein QOJ96_1476 [Alphaproteobacteria bacterium]|nr:hypothetical protein [Alphaproteobacteria bacterium]